MSESHNVWVGNVFRSLTPNGREKNDREPQKLGENKRRHESYSRALCHRDPPSPTVISTPPGWLSFKKKSAINQGSRFKEERQIDRGYKATTSERAREKDSETSPSTSSNGNKGKSRQSDAHGEKKDNGSASFDSNSDSYSGLNSDPKHGKDEDGYGIGDYDDDGFGNDYYPDSGYEE
ncbi:hypothetical protein F4680DRAFT_268251 [Xylaria scruposa]|nr:hypothetical protein F4680DRAFT_268251 [Xylaria scruposa]